jgi:hypothetical protein
MHLSPSKKGILTRRLPHGQKIAALLHKTLLHAQMGQPRLLRAWVANGVSPIARGRREHAERGRARLRCRRRASAIVRATASGNLCGMRKE